MGGYLKVFIEIQVAFATSCLLVVTEWEMGIESSQKKCTKRGDCRKGFSCIM